MRAVSVRACVTTCVLSQCVLGEGETNRDFFSCTCFPSNNTLLYTSTVYSIAFEHYYVIAIHEINENTALSTLLSALHCVKNRRTDLNLFGTATSVVQVI